MSVRTALDIEEDTKLSSETRTIGTARTAVHPRKILMVGFVRLLRDALKLSAVTGFRSEASLVSATSKLAAIVSSHPALGRALARKMLLRVLSSTVLPVSDAYISSHMASSAARLKSR